MTSVTHKLTEGQDPVYVEPWFTGRLEHLHTVHAVTRFGNKTLAIKRAPSSARHIFRSLDLHGIYEHSQGKQKKKVERGELGEESSWCGGVSLFRYGLHMSGGKCSFYPSKAPASATGHISLPRVKFTMLRLQPPGEWRREISLGGRWEIPAWLNEGL